MPSPRAVLIDIQKRGLRTDKGYTNLDKSGHLDKVVTEPKEIVDMLSTTLTEVISPITELSAPVLIESVTEIVAETVVEPEPVVEKVVEIIDEQLTIEQPIVNNIVEPVTVIATEPEVVKEEVVEEIQEVVKEEVKSDVEPSKKFGKRRGRKSNMNA